MEILNNKKLKPSLWPDVTQEHLMQLLETKDIIDMWKREWFIVWLVHLSWDVTHGSHLQYVNTIRAKMITRLWLLDKQVKLIVGVESDSRTQMRKNKANIYNEQERAYIFGNLKAVDHSYIEFEWVVWPMQNEPKPAWIVKYLEPNYMISHQEHVDNLTDYIAMSKRMMKDNWGRVMVINYWDDQKYLGIESFRDKFNRSTTNTIRQIFNSYRWNAKYDNQGTRATDQ